MNASDGHVPFCFVKKNGEHISLTVKFYAYSYAGTYLAAFAVSLRTRVFLIYCYDLEQLNYRKVFPLIRLSVLLCSLLGEISQVL